MTDPSPAATDAPKMVLFDSPERYNYRSPVSLLHREFSVQESVTVWSCKACGALVFDLQRHTYWHDEQAEVAQRTGSNEAGEPRD